MSQKIRVGIELNHVIRNINKQIVKYYQKDYDEFIDIDEVNCKDDVLKTVCHFKSTEEMLNFLIDEYPLEIFGHANECSRMLSRDLNAWLADLLNNEEYEIEVFFYSMREIGLTIPSTYFFASKIGTRVREIYCPKGYSDLKNLGDVFITANKFTVASLCSEKKVILIKTNFNQSAEKDAYKTYDSFRDFLDDDNKLNVITECLTQQKSGLLTWILSLPSYIRKTVENVQIAVLKKFTK